jgi:hypothetical protein
MAVTISTHLTPYTCPRLGGIAKHSPESTEAALEFGRLVFSHSTTEFVLKSIAFQDSLFRDKGKASGTKTIADKSMRTNLFRVLWSAMSAKSPIANSRKAIDGKADMSFFAIGTEANCHPVKISIVPPITNVATTVPFLET